MSRITELDSDWDSQSDFDYQDAKASERFYNNLNLELVA